MSYDMVKFDRGQVWTIYRKNYDSVGSEQDGDRPWLVLSVGKFNHSAGMITAVPITSRKSIRTPAQVLFKNEVGAFNVILCEQIRSFDYRSGEYEMEYKGILSDEVLEKVDVALSVHLGLYYSPITLNSLYDSMEAIIKSVGYMEQKNASPKFTDDDVLEFADKLQRLSKDLTGNDEGVSNGKKEKAGRVKPLKTSSKESKTGGEKKKRMKWTLDACKEFLDDTENLPMKETMKKWGMTKNARYYSMRNYARNVLKNSQK